MKLNGKHRTLEKKTTITNFLKKEGYNEERVAVEQNGIIISKDKFKTEYITDDDILEIVQFVGGG